MTKHYSSDTPNFFEIIFCMRLSMDSNMNMDIEISPLRGGFTNSFMCGAKASDPLMLVRGSF